MVSRSDFDLYCRAVDALASAASSEVEAQILEWCSSNPGATTAEAREQAISVLQRVADSYNAAAASLAAEWYDETVAATAAGIAAAGVLSSTASMDGGSIEKAVRYQAGKHADGDAAGFAKSCGDYAAEVAKQAVNNTVAANAKRDRAAGVRYARVPTGFETCMFCCMLASRGAVYWTRQTAGEMNHYHRYCDCKIVAGTADDPMAVLVEGCDPVEYKALWQAYEGVDASDLSTREKDAVKAAWADSILSGGSGKLSAAGLAGALEDGMQAAWKRFSKSGSSTAAYARTVNAYLDAVGEAYDIDACGGWESNAEGTPVFSRPNGDEIWAATRLLASGKESVRFLYASSTSKSPDCLINGAVAEIKTPRSAKKVAKRLSEAIGQLSGFENEDKTCVLSLLRLGDESSAVSTARRFVDDDDGLDRCYVILGGGALEMIG